MQTTITTQTSSTIGESAPVLRVSAGCCELIFRFPHERRVPLCPVKGANSLWSESAPGRGDYAAFEADAGHAVRFWGNRCRHYTVPNDSDQTRVSFDFRVIPERLFTPPSEEIVKLSKHSLCPGNSKRGYYSVAYPDARQEGFMTQGQGNQRSLTLGAKRRLWRESQGAAAAAAAAVSPSS